MDPAVYYWIVLSNQEELDQEQGGEAVSQHGDILGLSIMSAKGGTKDAVTRAAKELVPEIWPDQTS